MKRNICKVILLNLLVLTCLLAGVGCGDSDKECEHQWGEYAVTTQATCETAGIETRTCGKCNISETRTVNALGHDYGSWIEEVSPTYLQDGTKGHYHCSRCEKNFDESHTQISDLVIPKLTSSDNFQELDKDFPTVYQEGGNSYVNFGYYPQTVVSDAEVISALDSAIANGLQKNASGYYVLDNKYYVKAKATPYVDGESYLKFANGDTIESGKEYYFSVEQIKWRVLKQADGSITLITDKVIDVRVFDPLQNPEEVGGKTHNPNDYSLSSIRNWLNGEFYNTAFTTSGNGYISETQVDNGESTLYDKDTLNKYVYDDTTDKVFLPSYQDMYNENYGFNSDGDRRALSTDYVRAMGTYMVPLIGVEQNGIAKYWLRSATGSSVQEVSIISCYGQIGQNQSRIFNCTVRPMIVIKNK